MHDGCSESDAAAEKERVGERNRSHKWHPRLKGEVVSPIVHELHEYGRAKRSGLRIRKFYGHNLWMAPLWISVVPLLLPSVRPHLRHKSIYPFGFFALPGTQRPLGTERGRGRTQKMEKKPFRFAEGERGGAGERPFCPECHATSFVIDLSIGETRLLADRPRTTFHPVLSSRKREARALCGRPLRAWISKGRNIVPPLSRQSWVVYKSRWISLVRSGGFQGGKVDNIG